MFNRRNFGPRINSNVPFYVTMIVEDANIIWPDFSGAKGDGRHTFNLKFDIETGAKMAEDGWNIKLKHDDYRDEDYYVLPVEIRYQPSDDDKRFSDTYAAKDIWMEVDGHKTRLTEYATNTTASIGSLDGAEIENADVEICGAYRQRDSDNKWWYKAFCTQLFVELKTNRLRKKHGLYEMNMSTNIDSGKDYPIDE